MQALSVAQLVLPAGAGLALLSSPGLPSSGSPWWSGLEAVAPYCSLDCFHSQGKTSGFPITEGVSLGALVSGQHCTPGPL